MIKIGRASVLFAAWSLVPASARAEPYGFAIFEHQWARSEEIKSEPASRTQDRQQPRLGASASKLSVRESNYYVSVQKAERRYGLPSGLLQALVWTESRFNPMAISPAGAAGLTQLMPGTARYLGVVNRFDPWASIAGGARYLREMLDQFGAIHLALAAYNAGPGAVERAGGIPRNRETPRYVRSILDRWHTINSRN